MKKVLILIPFILDLITSACGQIQVRNVRSVEPELEDYVQDFEKEWGYDIDFKVVSTEADIEKYVGTCVIDVVGLKTVTIWKQYTDRVDYDTTEQLVWHELGHCALHREHNEYTIDMYNTGVEYPKSIMYPRVFNKAEMEVYKKEKQYYIDELFGRL